jgi:sigma-B regulation protein RsbU (phosphoserine phosphatase)
MMLGVFPGADYIADEAVIELAPGDSLIIYTDGATEAADAAGRQFGTAGLRRVVQRALARAPESPPLDKAIMAAVASYRLGAAQDDTLVVCATRG